MKECLVEDLGLIDYEKAFVYQKQIVQRVLDGEAPRLLFCEHPAILTMGRMFKEENLFFSEEELQERGVALRAVDRGGDITLHAPGQLVVYPIMRLPDDHQDLRWYLRQLEQVVVWVLDDFGIKAHGSDQQRGVWVGTDKIASMGIGVTKWVCYHGVGFNVNTDLSLFSLIRPCGLDVQMTSLQQIRGELVDMAQVKKVFENQVSRVFDFKMKEVAS